MSAYYGHFKASAALRRADAHPLHYQNESLPFHLIMTTMGVKTGYLKGAFLQALVI